MLEAQKDFLLSKVSTVAGYYSTTRPLVLLSKVAFNS